MKGNPEFAEKMRDQAIKSAQAQASAIRPIAFALYADRRTRLVYRMHYWNIAHQAQARAIYSRLGR